jgi:hypothetical protein
MNCQRNGHLMGIAEDEGALVMNLKELYEKSHFIFA